MTSQIKVPDMACEGCANSIKKALFTFSTDISTTIILSTKTVLIEFDESRYKLTDIVSVIENAGYTVDDQ